MTDRCFSQRIGRSCIACSDSFGWWHFPFSCRFYPAFSIRYLSVAVCSAEDDVDVFGRCPLLSYPKAWLLPTEKSADGDIINEVSFEVCLKVKFFLLGLNLPMPHSEGHKVYKMQSLSVI